MIGNDIDDDYDGEWPKQNDHKNINTVTDFDLSLPNISSEAEFGATNWKSIVISLPFGVCNNI